MNSSEVRRKYIEFFKNRDHKEIPSAPLVPENDPTTLFTSSGMQPLLPYFLGQPHPQGKRVVDSQIIFRAQDIEEVGDNRHDTLFEMLGNWSFGDYFKEEQLSWFFEFLTKEVGIDPHRLYVTAFIGDPSNNIPKDSESVKIWKKLFKTAGITAIDIEMDSEEKAAEDGTQGGKIFYYNAKKNWWSRAGVPENMPAGEPGGPDSEVFYEFTEVEHDSKYGKNCHPNCDCGRFIEIGNSVFMQYQKQKDGSFTELPAKNVDFGGGLERIVMVSNNEPDMFKNDLHFPIIEKLSLKLGVEYGKDIRITTAMRIIADHIRAAVFLINDNVVPSNKQQGYVLRRLLRRSAVKINVIKDNSQSMLSALVEEVVNIYQSTPYLENIDIAHVKNTINEELTKFQKTLRKGLAEIEKIENIDGKMAFGLYQTYGFPLELTEELVKEKGQQLDKEQFRDEFEKHKESSRSASAGMFKGGLQDQNETTTRYHSATHLLHAALRKILGDHVKQMGSNITSERMRFDFSHNEKLTEEQLKQIEELVNQKIKENLPVSMETMDKDAALQSGALGLFDERYGDKVNVYTIGHPKQSEGSIFSREICGGPHINQTGQIGNFKITKEESASAGIRRIYAVTD